MLLGIWAQFKVMGTYKKYNQVASRGGITGREAARIMLQRFGIMDVDIVSTQGTLTDHYDPSAKRLVLSEENYHGTSLAAIGVAAHEAGHAVQHQQGYSALQLRMSLVPITMFASKALPFVIIGGFFFQIMGLIYLGIAVYLVLTIFQLVTLPVEFDASARANSCIMELGIVDAHEAIGVKKTLDAAALTYVAAFIASLGNLLYLLSVARNND